METLFESDTVPWRSVRLQSLLILLPTTTNNTAQYRDLEAIRQGRVCNLPSRCEPSRRQSGTFCLAKPEVGRGRMDVASQGLTALLLAVPLICAVLSLASPEKAVSDYVRSS